MKEKYLLDEYIVSKFLGVGIDDPSIEMFLRNIREMMHLLVSNFLFDYSVLRNIDIDTALAAYYEYLSLLDGSLVDQAGMENIGTKFSAYRILSDEYFYNELEKRIDNYFGKIYAQYVPLLSEEDRQDIDEYIANKNISKQKDIDAMISKVDESLSEIEVMEAQLESKLNQMRMMGGTRRN
jgi:hypothetical protein